jgi:hypothetical protein
MFLKSFADGGGDVADLGLTFSVDAEALGSITTV